MKLWLFILTLLFSINTLSQTQDCGVVTIDRVLTGPRHGTMIQVNNLSCGSSGWLCLDPNGEYLTQSESDKLFAFILASKFSEKPVWIHAYTNVFTTTCGAYPVVEDVRTP